MILYYHLKKSGNSYHLRTVDEGRVPQVGEQVAISVGISYQDRSVEYYVVSHVRTNVYADGEQYYVVYLVEKRDEPEL